MDHSDSIPTAILQLLAEHDAGRQQFKVLRAAVAAAQAGETALATTVAHVEDVLAYLTGALELHIAKEEGPLFPRLKAALPAGDRLIDEMVAEHDLIRIKREALLTAVLEVLESGHSDLRADVQTLRDAVVVAPLQPSKHSAWLTEFAAAVHGVVEKAEVHFANEEELVFPLASQLLDAATLDRIQAEITVLDRTQG